MLIKWTSLVLINKLYKSISKNITKQMFMEIKTQPAQGTSYSFGAVAETVLE